jgi:hypothetical protein
MIDSLFLKHPTQHGFTYLEHLQRAWGLGWDLFRGSLALFVHGLVPAWFEYTGTSVIFSSHKKVITSHMRYDLHVDE